MSMTGAAGCMSLDNDDREVLPRGRAAALAWLLAGVGLRRAAPKDRSAAPRTTAQPDKCLYEQGTSASPRRSGCGAREYFRQLIDAYPQSPYRPDAKLGLGDTYLGEGTAESLVLAQNEFREFLTFYPTQPAGRLRAVQARHGALQADAEARARPDGDEEAIAEFETFVERYPEQHAAARSAGAAARGARPARRLASTGVGLFYYRGQVVPGRDRPVHARSSRTTRGSPTATPCTYYLAESADQARHRKAEALPYLDRLVEGVRQERVPRARAEAAGGCAARPS